MYLHNESEGLIMPLSMSKPGAEQIIKKVGGKDEVRKFLLKLGFIAGSPIKVISVTGGNVIVQIKEGRVAISREMATKILV